MPKQRRDPDFGARLKRAQTERRIRVRDTDLANAVNLTAQRIQSYHLGSYPEEPETIKEMADALEVDYDWLATGRGEMRPAPERLAETTRKLVDVCLYNQRADGAVPVDERDPLEVLQMEIEREGPHWSFRQKRANLAPIVKPNDVMVFVAESAELVIEPGHIVHAIVNGADEIGVLEKVHGKWAVDSVNRRGEPVPINRKDVQGVCVVLRKVDPSGIKTTVEYPLGLHTELFS